MRHYDTIVVGSGFGGSVLAARLAQAGERVLVLERGPWWGQGDGDARQPFPRGMRLGRFVRNVRLNRGRRSHEILLNRRGLFELHGFDHLWALSASGVGGGSLVYANGQGVPSPDYWGAFPPEVSAEDMAVHFKRADEVLNPGVLPDWRSRRHELDRALEASQLGETAPVELAVTFGPDPSRPEPVRNHAGVRQQTCRLCGDCVIGCPHRSKNTLDLTYLALAQRAGAVIRPLSEVSGIGSEQGRYRTRWVDHRSGKASAATSRRLVLAAGTLNTLRLLFAAGVAGVLTPLPDALGRNLSPNGDYASLLWRVKSARRPRVSSSTQFAATRTTPATGCSWARHQRRSTRCRCRRPCAGASGSRGSSSRWDATASFDGRAVRCDAGRSSNPEYFERVEATSRALAAHYEPRRAITNIPFGAASPTVATTHTVGGATMARRLEDAVVDHTGQVRGHAGLYIVDSSILAAPPGIPPSKTVLAMAERIASIAIEGGTP